MHASSNAAKPKYKMNAVVTSIPKGGITKLEYWHCRCEGAKPFALALNLLGSKCGEGV